MTAKHPPSIPPQRGSVRDGFAQDGAMVPRMVKPSPSGQPLKVNGGITVPAMVKPSPAPAAAPAAAPPPEK